MVNAMADLEKYINDDNTLDPLIQATLIHYQFETIHPFLDGNGRVGRLLITLFLIEKKIFTTPALYISYFLKLYRIEYYDRMSEVRRTGNYEQWVEFFLEAFSKSAEDAIKTIEILVDLHNRNITTLGNLSKKQHASVIKVFNYIETNPIIEISKTANALEMSYNTVSKAISILIGNGILDQTSKLGKSRIYTYTQYLNILKKGT